MKKVERPKSGLPVAQKRGDVKDGRIVMGLVSFFPPRRFIASNGTAGNWNELSSGKRAGD